MAEHEDIPSLSGIRVLVVDDDESTCLHVERALMARSAAVEIAGSGRIALQTLLRQDFDVVVVDLHMQEMDGLTLIQEARNIWPWLGFIIITGLLDNESSGTAARAGVRRVLEKPLRLHDLCQAVHQEYQDRLAAMKVLGPAAEQQRRQLKMLGRLGETALAAGTFVEALREMAGGLGELTASDVAGLLGFSDGQNLMVLCAKDGISAAYLDTVRDDLLARYRTLSGKPLDADQVRVQVEGGMLPGERHTLPGHLLTVPLIARNEVQGMLVLAYAGADSLALADTAFVYQIANVFSAVLSAVTRIRQMAAHDFLTRLYNRAHFEEQADRALQMARRHGYNMAVAIMDLDNFKLNNDNHGHAVGDQLLCEFAHILRSVARTSDVVARYGGDEFVVLFPQTDLPFAAMLGERIRKAVADHVFCADSLRLSMTTSIGLATSQDIGPAAPASEMLRLADMALYGAKRQGRDRVRLWSQAGGAAESSAAPPEGPHSPRILVLDDEPLVVQVVEMVLKKAGYRTGRSLTAADAINKVRSDPSGYDVLVTDLTLPESSGLEVISTIHQVDRFIMPIVMTGFATKDNAIASLREGAFDFIEKPVVPAKLLAVVAKALELRALRVENERYRLHLEDMVRQKSATVLETMEELKKSYDFALQAMVGLLDVREHNTGQHCNRVRALSLALGKIMGLPDKDIDALGHGALLHDIGKIAVPDAVLLKPGPLTSAEAEVMRTHAGVGNRILSASQYLTAAAEIVYQHHERYDGKGYPRGLKGDEICLGARIFAVIDAYDAMRSNRPYRESMSVEASIRELRAGSGTHFDPAIVEVFFANLKAMEAIGDWPHVVRGGRAM